MKTILTALRTAKRGERVRVFVKPGVKVSIVKQRGFARKLRAVLSGLRDES